MCDDRINEICYALTVIGSIGENERLETERKNGLLISPPTPLQGVLRWWYGEDRDKNLSVMEKWCNDAFVVIENCLEKEEAYRQADTVTHTRKAMDERMTNWQHIFRVQNALTLATEGLQRMKRSTYSSKKDTQARIKTMSDNISDKVARVHKSLKFMEKSCVRIGDDTPSRPASPVKAPTVRGFSGLDTLAHPSV